jgi:hypothetical protein
MSETATPPRLRPPQFIVDEEGKRVGVILDIESYQRLIEDYSDNRLIDESLGEATFPLEEVLREEDRRRSR